ncbi:MAG: TolC family protein, partial [Leptospiraceae bacterium]|nr:TolC family protein [Leptospiraceae bacterium]
MKKTALSISLFLLFAFASLTGQGATMNFGGIELTLEQAIDYVLQNNLTLKSAKYDVVMSDTEVARAEKKYAPLLSLDSQYTNTSPLQNIQNFARTKTQENLDVTLSVQKLFSTGTMVSAGVREN